MPAQLASCQAGTADLGLVRQSLLLCPDLMVTLSIGGPSDLTLDEVAGQTVLALAGVGLGIQEPEVEVAIEGGTVPGRVLGVGEDASVPIGLVAHSRGQVLTQGFQCLSNGNHGDPVAACREAARAMLIPAMPDLLPSPFLSIQLPSKEPGGSLGSASDGEVRITFDPAPTVEGALDAAALAEAIADRPYRYASCLPHVPREQVAAGPVEVAMRATLNGAGTNLDFKIKKLPDGELPPATDCLIQQIAASELPPPTDGQPATFDYTFTLTSDLSTSD